MTQQDTFRSIAEKSGQTLATVKSVFEAFAEVTQEALTKDKNDKIVIPKIGTLKVRHIESRTGKNPRTGEALTVPAQNRIVLANYKSQDLYKALN